MESTTTPQGLTDVLDQPVEKTEGNKVSLREVLESFDRKSFGPLLLVVALIALSPIGTIPGMSIVTGTLVILLAGQILLARSYPWLPNRLLSIEFSRNKLTESQKKARHYTKWIDTLIRPRWTFLAEGIAIYVLAVIIIGLAVLFYPLALVPFGVMAPAGAIALFALGITARDGFVVSLGLLLTGGAIWLTIQFWPF